MLPRHVLRPALHPRYAVFDHDSLDCWAFKPGTIHRLDSSCLSNRSGAKTSAVSIRCQGGYPVLPISDQLSEKADLSDVMLLAFQKQKTELSRPIQIGVGQLVGIKYSTSVPSREGESGGPWIDIGSGKAIAVASVVRTAPGNSANEATPIGLIRSVLGNYFVLATAPNPASTEPFKISSARADTRVAILGDTGGLARATNATGEIGRLVEVRARGDEKSDCDAGSGRTFSQAASRGQVTTFNANGLRFEYALEAQGGHYRTAATCLGETPVGLTGHDTSAGATVEMNGVVDFAISGTSVALDWRTMPDQGADYRLSKAGGEVVASDKLAGDGKKILQSLASGTYQLTGRLAAELRNRGACCGVSNAANETIAVIPVSEAQAR